MVKGKYRPAVFIVVYRRTKNLFGKEKIKYLLLKRKHHWVGWEFPKGGIDKGEKPMETAIRETKEECGQEGFDFRKYNFSGKYEYGRVLKDGPGFVGQTYTLFSAEVKGKKIVFDKKEHFGYRWVSFEKAMRKLSKKNQRRALEIVDGKVKKK